MQRLLFFLLCFFALQGWAQNQEISWLTNFEEAKKEAKKTKKPILVYFTGSDWCSPCIQLKEDFFDSQKFKSQANDLVLVLIDYPRRVDIISETQMEYNKKLMNQINPQKTFPLVIGFNYKGNEIDKISGYSSLRDPNYHFTLLETLLK